MKYFKNEDGQVFAFELDGSQDAFISKEMKKMTKAEIDRHLNPEKYLTDAEKQANYLKSLHPLPRRQFMLMLIEMDLDDAVEVAIAGIEDVKQRKKLSIEYHDGQTFERQSEAVLKIFELLKLEELKVNEMWEAALLL